MFLQNLKTFENENSRKYVYLVSIGALEQHGSYAPLGTDTIIQEALLQKVEREVPEVIFLPTIPIGASWNHIGFWGTISLKDETVYSVITDVVESISSTSNMIIFVSWHGGNKPIIDDYIANNKSTFPQIKLVHITFGSEDTDKAAENVIGGELDDHAGNIEVSMALALSPKYTVQPKVGSKKKAIKFDWKDTVKSVTSEGIIDANPNWSATKEIGDYLVDVYSKSLVSQIKVLVKTLN